MTVQRPSREQLAREHGAKTAAQRREHQKQTTVVATPTMAGAFDPITGRLMDAGELVTVFGLQENDGRIGPAWEDDGWR